jgi:hypothetical protein
MAKDKDKHKHRDAAKAEKHAGGRHKGAEPVGAQGESGGQHHAATAHGEPAEVDTSLPATRAELLILHAAARQRRNTAELGSDAHRAAVTDLERIEVRVAAIERAQDPPLG